MKRRGSPAIKYGSSGSVAETGAQQGKSSSLATIRQTEGNGQEKSSGRASAENVGKIERRSPPSFNGSSNSVDETGARRGKSYSTVTIRQTEGNSQEKSSGKASAEVENRGSDNGNAASDNGKRGPKYTVLDGGDTTGKESALADAYDKAVKQGKGVEISETDLKKYQNIRDDPEQTLIKAVKKYYEESLKGTSVEVTANNGVVEIRFEKNLSAGG